MIAGLTLVRDKDRRFHLELDARHAVMVEWVLSKAAAMPCNGDNNSRRRRPCTTRDKHLCPWCTARRLLRRPRQAVRS